MRCSVLPDVSSYSPYTQDSMNIIREGVESLYEPEKHEICHKKLLHIKSKQYGHLDKSYTMTTSVYMTIWMEEIL